MYDNTKLRAAMAGWISADCKKGFGEAYAGELLDSFLAYCTQTGAMKRSPGRVVFGKELTRLGYEKRKVGGLTHYAGIVLKTKPAKSSARLYKKAETRMHQASAERDKVAKKRAVEKPLKKEAARKERLKKIKKRMHKETAKSAVAAGQTNAGINIQ